MLVALDPRYGFATFSGTAYRLSGAGRGFSLCDRRRGPLCRHGPFRTAADPVRLVWFGAADAASELCRTDRVVVEAAAPASNPFFALVPSALQMPLVGLATIATIIASQAIISGAFSMTRQAIQLGFARACTSPQTSSEGYGQIYVGFVNWALMALTLALTLGFRSSDNLAAAFGIAVSLTMFLTSVLLFLAMREIWRWSFADRHRHSRRCSSLSISPLSPPT